MNAGAYGGQIADVVERATVITKDGAVLEIREKR